MVVYYIIAIAVIAIDQWTKWLVVQNMNVGERIPIIEGFFYWTSHRNEGAAFGILQGQMWFFYIVTIFVIGFVIYYLHKEARGRKWLGTALGLVLGGAIGNFIDRVLQGEVVDFIDVFIFTYNYPIFNVADMALVIGVGILIIIILREDVEQRKNEK